MYGSVAIVTGGNSGLGKAVAQHLLFQNAEVVLACRNMTACELARAELTSDFQSEFPDKTCKCRCEYLDVEDHESIRAFSKSMAKQHPGNIKLLVNNAGASSVPRNVDSSVADVGLPSYSGPQYIGSQTLFSPRVYLISSVMCA